MDLTWYSMLAKPALTPPSWLFGPAWTVLYVLMAVALILVWTNKTAGKDLKQRAIWLFFGQLVLNLIWSPLFFILQQPGWALLDLIVMWWAIFVTIRAFRKISKPAAWLLIPYLAWVTFAGYLNLSIWLLNR